MSLRINISGFNYSQMASYFGSKDENLKKQLASEFEQLIEEPEDDEEEDDTFEQAVKVIDTVINHGVSVEKVNEENDIYCYVVNLFAHHEQEHVLTGSCDWKMKVLWDMQEAYSGKLTAKMEQYLRYFIDGRPIFGKKIQPSWNYYAYFTNSEVKELEKELKLLTRQFQNDKMFSKYQEFIDEFQGWISVILANQKDLWFWAN